jgi:hypothetical protein
MSTPIPIHPQPGIYETTVSIGHNDTLVDPQVIEQIAARPHWSLEMAKARVDGRIAAYRKPKPRRRR